MKPAMIRSTLSLAVIALFAAGCGTTQPAAMNDSQSVSYVGPAGATGATGAFGDPQMQRNGRVEVLVSSQ